VSQPNRRAVARRTPKDQWRGPHVYSPDQIHVPRRGYPPTQTWRTFLRNQAFGIVTIGLSQTGRLSDKLPALVRRRIARAIRCVTKVRDGIPWRLVEPSSTSHRLQPYSSACGSRSLHAAPSLAHHPNFGGDNWMMAGRGLSPYRSRGSPRRTLPDPQKFCTARERQAKSHFLQCDCSAHLPRTTRSKKPMILNAPPLSGDASASRLSRTRL
jgi:hypothetical protein